MERIKKNYVLDMTTGSPARLLLKFALPLVIGNVLQQFYNMADTAIAGHLLGDQALAQIGATSALYSLITNFCFGMNNGLSLAVSRSFGANDKKEMKQSVCWMINLSLSFGIILMAAFLIFRRPLLAALQTPDDVIRGALNYLTIILIGIPLTMIYNLESGLLRAVGNSITPLWFLLFSSILNVILDLAFMGPLNMGVSGAAIATVLSQGISALLGLLYIMRFYPEFRFAKETLRVPLSFVTDMLWSGISMALMTTIYSIGSVILQSSINALGSVYIAAQVGARRLAEFFFTPGASISTAIATFSSQNYGAGKRTRILRGVQTAVLIYVLWWLIAVALTFLLSPWLIRLITGSTSETIISSAVLYMKINIPSMPPLIILAILRSTLQGMKHQLAPLFCSLIEMAIKAVFAFFIVPSIGYFAVCICEPITWLTCAIFIMGAALIWRADFRDAKEAILH